MRNITARACSKAAIGRRTARWRLSVVVHAEAAGRAALRRGHVVVAARVIGRAAGHAATAAGSHRHAAVVARAAVVVEAHARARHLAGAAADESVHLRLGFGCCHEGFYQDQSWG